MTLLWLTPAGLAGQASVSLEGRVLRVTAGDTVPVPRMQVVAHEVGHARQGPVDSLLTDGRGGFRFSFQADTGSVILVSARHAGIEYFSDPVPVEAASRVVKGLDLVVSDTSSKAPVGIASRHLVIGRPNEQGDRPVLEIVMLRNDGPLTRVGSDADAATWVGRIPAGSHRFSVGEGAYSTEALTSRDDSVILIAPLAPGEKQLLYSYALPPTLKTVRLPVDAPIGQMTLLMEELDLRVTGGTLALTDTQSFEGRAFQRWSGTASPGEVIEVRLGGRERNWGLVLMVGAMALLLSSAGLVALRRRPSAAADPRRSLLDQIARLDARYAGRQADVPPEEWAGYLAERARLKAALQGQLAPGDPTT
jgi:hypothetical protein